ncbi:MAG: YjjG family noncanonical pyrimidine nucleotidase [Saprospiraceae bacterium]|nr:YjjG family noncanonical pyrimidine nucleotidase [Saprospiraceae bacterium]
MNKHKYRYLLIDADHTIYDFDRSQAEALERTFAAFEQSFRPEWHSIYTKYNLAAWDAHERGILTREEIRTVRFTQLAKEVGIELDAEAYHERYVENLSQIVHYLDTAEDTLHVLAQHFGLALITNGLPNVQRPRLARSSITPLFKAIVISGEIHRTKPDPDFFAHTVEALGGPAPDECLVIGDNLFADIGGGQQAGMHTCWFNPTGKPNQEPGVQPTYSVRTWMDIRQMLLD